MSDEAMQTLAEDIAWLLIGCLLGVAAFGWWKLLVWGWVLL